MESIVSWEKNVYSIKCWDSGFICPVVVEFLRRWGGGIYFLLVFDFWCLKSRSVLSVELLDAQWGYVVDFLFKQGKAACNFISFLYFIKTARFNKKRLQKEENQKLQKTELLQGKDCKFWSSE